MFFNNQKTSLIILCSCLSGASASSENHITVLSGQVLTESDLQSGVFLGQNFDLSPGTFFDVETGGVIGPTPSSSVGSPFDFGGSTINVFNGGQYSAFLQPESYATNLNLNANTGSVIFDLYLSGTSSVMNVHGGAVFLGSASSGATVNFTSGTVGSAFEISNGSYMNFSGGVLGGLFSASDQSVVNMTGGLMKINSRVTDKSEFYLSDGVVQDGFRSETGSMVHISGGEIQNQFTARLSTVHISGGQIGNEYRTFTNETIISGGHIGNSFWADSGSMIEMTAGSIGDNLQLGPEIFFAQHVVANIYGGSIGDHATIRSRGTLNLYGGSIGESLRANIGSQVNLFVKELTIDGISIELDFHKQTVIETRDGSLLEAILVDGSYIDLNLNSRFVAGEDLFHSSHGLTVTFVPSPGSGLILGLGGLSMCRRRRA
ncbi:MAG: hypothetical protein P1U42_11495 [Phycisphaerales bacterium]|nr:hypothetical protein [Phycisphaerales bacterium]